MKVLYIASNPAGQATLQVEEEANELQDKIDVVLTSGNIDLRIYSKLRVSDLPQTIARVRPDIIHFSAHGEFEGIILSHGDQEVTLSGENLAAIIRALDFRPKLIVVNACSSETVAEALISVADFTIGTTAPITNAGAIVMAATLYQHLAASASIQSAFDSAWAMLDGVDGGAVQTRLFCAPGRVASEVKLNETFRILACLPALDKCIQEGTAPPDFHNKSINIQYGIADAPAAATQIVFFTDDDTVKPWGENGTLEDARSWLQEVRPYRGEHWIDPSYTYWGDMQWFATVVTAEAAFFTAAATTCEALERYYFKEKWAGQLSVPQSASARGAIESLRAHDGSRRAAFVLTGGKQSMVDNHPSEHVG